MQQETAKDGMAGLQSGNKIWKEKSRSGSQGKVAVQEISPRSIPMQGIKSVLINATENELKRKG